MPRMCRFRRFGLLVRMCRLNAFERKNLPVLVFLKRFAAPRALCSFGMCPLSCSRGSRLPRFGPALRPASAPGSCGAGCLAFLLRFLLGSGDLHRLAHQAVENLAADFRVPFSRPRKKIVALTLSPSERKRSMCFFLNW